MKYMGSKNRYAKELLPIILKNRRCDQYYVEPFVGGANMIDKVDGNRLGGDSNVYLIEALKLIRDNPASIPMVITENMYDVMKINKKINGLTGFTAFAMSFGGKFFGGYRRDVAGTKGCVKNMETQTRRSKNSAFKQSFKLKNVDLCHSDYLALSIPLKSIIYCDPPYAGTTKYRDSFDHSVFWDWCRKKVIEGHSIFVSEYAAPNDFICVWKKKVNSSLTKQTSSKKSIERLFIHESQLRYLNT